jgi:hypothetical protein
MEHYLIIHDPKGSVVLKVNQNKIKTTEKLKEITELVVDPNFKK